MRTDILRHVTGALLLLIAVALPAWAQRAAQSNPNAALRYWMAFALMQDPPVDDATRNFLEALAERGGPWDEAGLGSLLDANDEALRIMQRATSLPDCDWGLEYEMGPGMPIAHLARARVLARLNVLAGMRAMAAGDAREATNTWVAGLRFAQHVPRGGGVLATLTGRVMLGSTMAAITRAIEGGSLDSAQQQQVREALRGIPETGFDWGAAYERERVAIDGWAARLLRDPMPERAYERAVGAPLPPGVSLPRAADVTAFATFINQAARAIRLPPAAADKQLEELQKALQALHPFYRPLVPSLTRISETRTQVKTERDRLVAALER
jgi:hypothetical protein